MFIFLLDTLCSEGPWKITSEEIGKPLSYFYPQISGSANSTKITVYCYYGAKTVSNTKILWTAVGSESRLFPLFWSTALQEEDGGTPQIVFLHPSKPLVLLGKKKIDLNIRLKIDENEIDENENHLDTPNRLTMMYFRLSRFNK